MNVKRIRGTFHGVVANVLDCVIVVGAFELQSCCYVHLWSNTQGKRMNTVIPPSYGFGIK